MSFFENRNLKTNISLNYYCKPIIKLNCYCDYRDKNLRYKSYYSIKQPSISKFKIRINRMDLNSCSRIIKTYGFADMKKNLNNSLFIN